MELEQEVAESRDEFSMHQDQGQHQHPPFAAEGVGGCSRRMSVGGGDRAEERALRAKNEMLERQLAHMREEAEETQLELAAARKVLGGVFCFGGGDWLKYRLRRWRWRRCCCRGVRCIDFAALLPSRLGR